MSGMGNVKLKEDEVRKGGVFEFTKVQKSQFVQDGNSKDTNYPKVFSDREP